MLLLSSLLVSCSQFKPPESCGAGGTANKETFNQFFVDMLLYDETMGGPPRIHTEAGPTFLLDSTVSIQAESFITVEVRFCVEQRRGGGEISFDEVRMISEGVNTISLDGFESGSYVLRVIQDEVLIRNLPFVVE
jgi:hypothetical protein